MPNVFYSDEYVTLYHGDCLEITEWLEADVLVTDPPYGIRAESKKGSYRGAGSQVRRAADITGDESVMSRDDALKHWGDKPLMVFGSWKAPRPARVDHRLIWWKRGSNFGVANCSWLSQDEEIYVAGKGFVRSSPPKRSVFATDEPRSVAVQQIGHPTPKPVTLMEWLIERCQPEWTIADPFAGSGSTLVAAKRLGRRAIGVELEEKYCEIAARRLSQDVLDLEGLTA